MEKWFELYLENVLGSFYQYSNKTISYQYYKAFSIIARFLRPEARVLDWGCGNGFLSAFLLYNNQQTTAYGFGESSPPALLANEAHFKFLSADTKEPVKLPFANDYFDIVLSMGVLEHVHETGGEQCASLQEINRVLKPGGYFICLHFPYSRGWVESFLKMIMPFLKNKPYVHTMRFSQEDAMKLVHDSGLKFHEWGRYNFFPRNVTRKLPVAIANNALFVSLFNAFDTALASIFPCFCNHSYFIVQKWTQPSA